MNHKKYYHLSCEVTPATGGKKSCTSILETTQSTSESGLAEWVMKTYKRERGTIRQ